jgi:hypothetical protein
MLNCHLAHLSFAGRAKVPSQSYIAIHCKQDVQDNISQPAREVYYQAYSEELQVYHLVREGVQCKIEGVKDEVWHVRGSI